MKKIKVYNLIKDVFTGFSVILFGFTAVIFSVLYFNTFNDGVVYRYFDIFSYVTVVIISLLTVLTLILSLRDNQLVYKLFFVTIFLSSILILGLYLFRESGLYLKIKSVEDLRTFISGFGAGAVIIYVLICFLSVLAVPIPGIITLSAGVLLFGPFFTAIYNFIGYVLGSYCAYFIGKIFGYKFACWFVGEGTLNKWQARLKGKDRVLFTVMFLFPFFPDDILSFISGIIKMPTKYFVCMIFVVRLVTAFVSAYSINNSLIPYDTWWGIAIWVFLFLSVFIITVYVYKNGEKIQNIFLEKS